MKFDPATPRVNTVIAEHIFTVPAPFTPGHVCTENEAGALNQLVRENVRNNLASRLKADKDGNIKGLTQEDVDAYVQTYEFGQRTRGSGEAALSPVERKARAIAKEKISARLKELGKTLPKGDEGKAQMEAWVAEVAARPEVIKAAEKQLRDVEKLALDDIAPPAAAPAQAA